MRVLQCFSFLSLLALATASASLYAEDEPVIELAIQKLVNAAIAIESQLVEFTLEVSDVGDLPVTLKSLSPGQYPMRFVLP